MNAVRGFFEMTAKILTDHSPDEVIATFDNEWRPAFRVDAYPGYKAERAPDPPELPPQFDVIATILDAAGIRRAEAAGLEADDVLATLVGQVSGDDVATIVTGDRDLLALVRDPNVELLFTIKGVSELKRFNEADVMKEYGIPPILYTDLAMLRGDPSDGLPGVPGIGPVRAAKLLGQYGSIEGILAHVDELPPKQASSLRDAEDYLAAVEKVVPMVADADVVITERHEPDEVALKSLDDEYNLGGARTRLIRGLRGER